jgi:methylthioribose-1-phosphate isomerase
MLWVLGVWSNVNSWTPTLVSGYFTGKSIVWHKQVICLVVCNQAFVATTGWGTASSITGSTSASSCN